MTQHLRPGKLPAADLQDLLDRLDRADPRLVVGPRTGEDAAVIEMGDRVLVVATDPVTFATDRIGAYAVHVNANDVAVLGARPRWFFAVVLLPEATAARGQAEAIMEDVAGACDALGATVAGGHTEITVGLDRPVVIGQMLGEVAPARLVRKTRMAPGDQVLLTRGAAIEGTAILAREMRARLSPWLPASLLDRAADLLTDPGISIVEAALAAADAADLHGLHDPTEGGVIAGLVELAAASGLGLRVDEGAIPVLPETAAVCAVLGLDPLRLIASGALLVVAPPGSIDPIERALAKRGVAARVVGELRPAGEGLQIERDGRLAPLVGPARDELARVFEATRDRG